MIEKVGTCPVIPKIIHQIWLGKHKPPKSWMNSWLDFCNKYKWEYMLWDDEKIEKFNLINKNAFDKASSFQEKADIARYEVMYKHGGIYIDCDMVWLGKDLSIYIPLNQTMFIGVQEFPGWSDIGAPYLCNGFFASPPKHKILKRCIDEIGNIKDSFINNMTPAWVKTGPVLLNRCVKEAIIIIPYKFIFPKDFHKANGIHHCEMKDEALVYTYNGSEYEHLKNSKNDFTLLILFLLALAYLFYSKYF